MGKKQPARGRRGPKKPVDVVWIGGSALMTNYVWDEAEPYRPASLIWMSAEGAILGATAVKPEELLNRASESLQHTIDNPIQGRPHKPTQVRVASSDLANILRDSHPGIEIVCAPTPEMDEVLAFMTADMSKDEEPEPSYLSPEIGPEVMASFFGAAAKLFRAKPWEVVPSDTSLFAVTIKQLGLRDDVLSVIGQMGQSLGIILFSDLEDFYAYVEAADTIEFDENLELPPHFVFDFEHRSHIAPSLRREIAEHKWEVAAANAYPRLLAVDEDLVARPPTIHELTMSEAIALALTKVLSEEKALRDAWMGGKPLSRTLSVQTHGGDIEVTLRAPYELENTHLRPPHDVFADLFDLARTADEFDRDALLPVENELLRRFAVSPEVSNIDRLDTCGLVMELAATFFEETIATLNPADLRTIIFELIPNKAVIEASEARRIIQEIRAFYSFLRREFAFEQADDYLVPLDDDAAQKLEDALSDSSNFGMAKTMFIAGRLAGFDMNTEEGTEAWKQTIEEKPIPPGVPLPSLSESPPNGRKAASRRTKNQKNQRKAARKATRRVRKKKR